MAVNVLVSLLCCGVLSLPAGESGLICPTQPIQAGEGDDVALQCRLDPAANLTDYILYVLRADLDEVVHSYRHGKDHSDPQADQYSGRTTLTHEDLIRGNITLQISSVQLDDSGPYRCYVPHLKANCTIILTVAKKSNKTTTDDFTTVRPEVTENTDPDAGKVNVGAIIGGVLGVALVLGALIIGVLVKCGTIKLCKEAHRKTLEPNKYEMETLRPPATRGG